MNDGGSAFPQPGATRPNGDYDWGDSGMTLRAYFIAHAPEHPPAWFQPTMATPRPKPDWRGLPTSRQRDLAPGLLLTDVPVDQLDRFSLPSEANKACGEEWMINVSGMDQDEWDRQRERERFLQWPAAWADEQIKRINA